MSLTYEKLEGNMAELTITVPAEDFNKACVEVYNRTKNKFQFDGFRKGHVPMAFIEKTYGYAVFYEDAANDLINKTYFEEIKDCDLDIVSNPDISVSQIEKGKDFIFTAKVATKPPVTLGQYKGIEIEKIDRYVTEADVDAEIEKARKENARKVDVTDRAAQEGDEAIINFEGFIDGTPFDGGKGEEYALKLGSHSFIDTFEEQIVGKNIGDKFDVEVKFPENYQAEDLAGQPATFKVELLGIKEEILPELDDEFASEVSEFETLAEYREDTQKILEVKKEEAARKEKEAKCLEKLIETSEIDLPEPMIMFQQEKILDEFEMQLRYQGLNLEQYYTITKQTREDMLSQVKPEAERRIRTSLIIEEVVKAEGIEASEDEVNEKISKMAEQYQLDVEKFKELAGEKEIEAIKMDVAMEKAVKLIAESAKEA